MKRLLKEMETYAAANAIPILRTAEVELLRRITASAAPRRVLEIGTAIGYSALLLASRLGRGGTITTIECDAERVQLAKTYIGRSPYAAVIDVIHGDGTTLAEELDGPWDFVFLDGPKGQYVRQLRLLLPKLSPQAIVVADNIRYHDMVYMEGVLPHKHRTAVLRLREYMELISDERCFQSVVFENGDGLTVSRWKG
ncbi:O-methyltransferase [Megasphaera vaginalis (ex Bordigoni et al. 2020)]|uniref:O-methyltransferase n=1 Tax=Megasphaera vaginalis (ex Bordigoni et al. 2020) TaxID=2045301 RepID=UPI000C7BE625|nr:O-methyltransferase [Megasphaera vaginalis (ex Bordigoni et al. 2020)]